MQKNLTTALLAALTLSGAAGADIIDHAGAVPLADTNWMVGISVPKFDAALGTLTKVTWSFSGTIMGDMRFESLDSAPSTVNVNIQATMMLMLADLSPLITINPSLDRTDDVTEFDLVSDFGGTSGRSYVGLSDTESGNGSATDAATLAFVTGAGNIDLLASAVASTSATGAGNLQQLFLSQATGEYKVSYEYTPVPTPGAMALIGLAGLSVGRRRR